jgi:hypothetical protein
MLDHLGEHARQDVAVLRRAVDPLHVGLLHGHELEERAVDVAERRVRGELVDAFLVGFDDVVAQILEQVLYGLVMEVERLAVYHRPLGQLLDGNVRERHLANHLLDGAFDSRAGLHHPQIALHLVCHPVTSHSFL